MDRESKLPFPENVDTEYDVDSIRNDLLRCPGIGTNSEAMQVALTALDEVEEIIKVKIQLEMKNVTLKQEREYNSNISSSFAAFPSTTNPAIPTHINVNNIKSENNNDNYATDLKGNLDQQENDVKKEEDISDTQKSWSILLKILRTITIDLPLLSLFILTLMTYSLSHVYDNYLGPQINFMKYTDENRTNDISYYHHVCPLGEMSTTKVDDLLIGDDFTTDDCAEHMMVHGNSIYKDLIKADTAKELRAYVIEKNKNLKSKDAIGVISNENRWSFGIGANDHPSVSKALNEIATNEVFRPALEKIAGRNPAMIEMTAITAGYGATDQFWHPDIVSMGSPAKYVKNFVPSYALFVTLQDTTAAMGATGVCPGTYMCSNEDATDTCEGHGFQVADDNNTVWKTGDGLLMNQQSFHRGAAHIDPTAPHRVVFIVTFSPRPKETGDTRMVGLGGSYSLRWDMWGHTLNDLENAPSTMIQPWTTLRALGLYKPKNADWGWDFIFQQSVRAANRDTGYEDKGDFLSMVTIPDVLLPKFERKMSYEDYFRTCTKQWKSWAQMINGIALASYFLISFLIGLIGMLFSNRFSRKVFKGILWTTMRMIILYSLAASVAYYLVMKRIPTSPWARSIVNGNLFYPPFTTNKSLKSTFLSERGPFVIDENDILISDRYNDKALNSLTDTLKYHQGNMELNSHIKGAIESFSFLSNNDKNQIARTIVDDTFNRGSKFAFLNDNSVWVPLTGTEAVNYVLNEMNMEAKPLLQSLTKEASFILTELRYGLIKFTAMSRRLGYPHVTQLMEEISAKFDVPFVDLYRVEDNESLHKVSIPTSEVKSIAFYKSLFTKPTIKNIRSLPPKQIRIPTLAPKELRDTGITILRKGDIVEGQYKTVHNEWYKGTIVNIFQGSKIDVRYMDGELDYDLDSKNVKPFKPYQVGEIIEVNLDDEDEFFQVEVVRTLRDRLVVKTIGNGHRNKTFNVAETSVRRFY